jgi:hypothetical protein
MMILFLESIFVGVFTLLVSIPFLEYFSWIKSSFYHKCLLLFCIGFTKHFFGYVLGIQTAYCQWRHVYKQNECIKKNSFVDAKNQNNTNKIIKQVKKKVKEGLWEGVVFLIFGVLFMFCFSSTYFMFFILGVVLHLLFEYLGYHTAFCCTSCLDNFFYLDM